MAIDVKTATDSSFIGSGISESLFGCDAIYFYAYSDNTLTTLFSDSRVTLTTADTISPGASSVTTQFLNIDTSNGFS